MFWGIFFLITAIKLLLAPAYRSTDFEVHRNWLAITHSLPLSRWYFDNTSEWTLDYPPFFAYFEYGLSHIGKHFDKEMLKVENLNYSSEPCVMFQRLSVIFTDIVYAFGTKLCIKTLGLTTDGQKTLLAALLMTNVGLLFVDHIHFQYNGFLLGILLFSIAKMMQQKYLQSALLFCVLLNMKHIFIYIAPAYVVFLFKFYCLQSKNPIGNLLKLVAVVGSCVVASFGPFYDHLPQVWSRLFPFKRGLTHAYWAPNFWALYNFGDKVASVAFKTGTGINTNTKGLVQEFEHQVLPSINPLVTFILTGLFMMPCLIKLFFTKDNQKIGEDFVRAIVLCSCTAFMFGWHVHEKAILMVLIPLSVLSANNQLEGELTLFLGVIAHYSLFPLLFKSELFLIKVCAHFHYSLASCVGLQAVHSSFKLKIYETFYILGFILLLAYEYGLHQLLNLDEKLPFLPLMLTSVYCSIGVLYFYCKYYYIFLSTKSITTTTTTSSDISKLNKYKTN